MQQLPPWLAAALAAALATPVVGAAAFASLLWLVHLWDLPAWVVFAATAVVTLLGAAAAGRAAFNWSRGAVRYRLRHLLVVTTLLAVLFGTIGRTLLRQSMAVHDLYQSGVYVEDLVSDEDDWLEQRLGFDPFEVTRLEVRGPGGVDAILRHADSLRHLESVAFYRRAGDSALARVAELNGLPNLTQAAVYSPAVTDEGIARLGEWNNLTHLFINGPRITDRGLEHIGRMHHLESLVVMSERNLPPLPITDAGLASIAELPRLSRLWILHTPVTADGLLQLSGLPRLKWLHAPANGLTTEEHRRLCLAMPNCLVSTDERRLCLPEQVARLVVVEGDPEGTPNGAVNDAGTIAAVLDLLEQWAADQQIAWEEYDPAAGEPPGLWLRFIGPESQIIQCGLCDGHFYRPWLSRKGAISDAEQEKLRTLLP